MTDEYLQSQGVVVSSLQFDGLHVEHIAGDEYEPGLGWRRLEEAIRRAEDAVQRKLGYKIGLMEKPLFSRGLHYYGMHYNDYKHHNRFLKLADHNRQDGLPMFHTK